MIPRKMLEYRVRHRRNGRGPLSWRASPARLWLTNWRNSNAPGSRHPKRYLDVLDLWLRPIDVFTTVNVQHLDSRADAVTRSRAFPCAKPWPDLLIDIANKIELIDIEPKNYA